MQAYKLFPFLALITAVVLSGCETVKGIGRDIEGASTTVQRSLSGGRR